MKLTRPVTAMVVAVSLLSTGAATAAVKPKPKPIPPCTSLSDPTGDTGPSAVSAVPPVPVADPTLDLTKVTYTYTDKVFVAKVDVSKYADTSTYSDGVRFDVNFTIDGKVVTLFAQKSRTEAVESTAFAFAGIKIDNAFKAGTNKLVTAASSGNTFAITASVGDIETALGAPLIGKKVTALNAISWGFYEAVSLPYDNASDDSKSFTFTNCK